MSIQKNDTITMAHGEGGRLSHNLITSVFHDAFKNIGLSVLDDGALLPAETTASVFTTDSYVINPLEFPGGDIGTLAVSGTVNDLAVMGAQPRWLSLGLILEEGLSIAQLKRIVHSIAQTCSSAPIQLVTGDTKVVDAGHGDGIYINTSAIGTQVFSPAPALQRIKKDDVIIINGFIGDHGITIMSQRTGLQFDTPLQTDCAPLWNLIESLRDYAADIHMMRDATRGGIATVCWECVNGSSFSIELDETKLPIQPAVSGACELLGIEPWFIANEGKVVFFVNPDAADTVLKLLHKHPHGTHAAIIGHVTERSAHSVLLKTTIGTRRIIDIPAGTQLPRIC